MEALGEAYAPAIALDGWNYIRYLGPFTSKPPPEPVFMRVDKDELVVAPNREPSKLWSVVRLRAPEDGINRHACALKREGRDVFIGYRLYPSEGKGEIVLGPQARLDVFRVTRMKKPSYIRVYAPPLDECSNPASNNAQTPIAGPSDSGNAAEMGIGAVTNPEPPATVEWYLGISADLKVVVKPFPPMSEWSAEMTSKIPVWEFTSREEAIRQDYPSFAAPIQQPSQANNPMSREYYLQPDRFEKYDRDFWPPTQPRRSK